MKTKILIIALLLSCSLTSRAQITLDHVYTTDVPTRAYKLALSGLKYYGEYFDFNPGPTYFSTVYFVLYNPDHSIFKTINVPQIAGKRAQFISYVSETLFDTDTLIEYMVSYNTSTSGAPVTVRVLSENNSVLLNVDSSGYYTGVSQSTSEGYIDPPIFPDGNQSKLYLNVNGRCQVYNLPGQLPCLECSGGLIQGITSNTGVISTQPKPFPNPSTDHFNIKYILPADAKSVFLEMYDMEGSLVKKSRLNNKSNQTTVSNDELTTGQFIYRIIADGKMIVTDKIIVTK